MSETAVEPLFQRLIHKVKIDRFNLLRDLGELITAQHVESESLNTSS